MNFAMWILAGGVVGWIGSKVLKVNEYGGMIIPVTIGVLGGLFGGNVLAPMLGAATETPNDFSLFSLVVALACAAGCLAIGNLISSRYGV